MYLEEIFYLKIDFIPFPNPNDKTLAFTILKKGIIDKNIISWTSLSSQEELKQIKRFKMLFEKDIN